MVTNELLFSCATMPGKPRCFNELLGMDGAALRSRVARELGAAVIGRTCGDIARAWDDAVLVGVLPCAASDALVPDAFAPEPSRTIAPDDVLLFVADGDTPTARVAVRVAADNAAARALVGEDDGDGDDDDDEVRAGREKGEGWDADEPPRPAPAE